MLKVYEKLLTAEKRYFSGKEVAVILGITPVSQGVTLSRLVKRKILRRLQRNLYEVILRPSDILEAANVIYQPSYLSFTYCLGKLGILDQIAYEIEFATPKKTKRVLIRGRNIIFRQVKNSLFFGYTLKDNIYTAKPEKALLDTLYLRSKGIASLNEEDLNLGDISRSRFLKMSKPFPLEVRREAVRIAKKMRKR